MKHISKVKIWFFLLLFGYSMDQSIASHFTGEAITLRKLPNGNSVFQIWVIRDCSNLPINQDTFNLKTTTPTTIGLIPCSFVSSKQMSPVCWNVFGQPNIPNFNCNTSNHGSEGSFSLNLYESAPINLDLFSFSPNSWVRFYITDIPCCISNFISNYNNSIINSFLSLKTNNNGKIISKSSLQIKEWPQTSFVITDSNAMKNSMLFSADGNSTWEWTHATPKVFENNNIVNYPYRTSTGTPRVVTPFPFPFYQRRPQTNVFEFNVSTVPASDLRYVLYVEANQITNGSLVGTLSFYLTTRIFSFAPSLTINQESPQFSTIATPFAFNQTPIIYASPGDTVEFNSSVKNKFSLPSMELNTRLSGEFASPCSNPPCATISPLPGTNATTIFYQGQNSGQGVSYTGNDSGQLDYKFRWIPRWQHLQYDSITQSHIPRVFPFTFHATNMICPATASNFQPFFISLFNPNPPLIRPANAQILPGDSCRVQIAASLDSTSANANAMGVDYQMYLQKQSQLKMLCHLESSNSPFGPFQRCSPQQPMVYNSGNSAFALTLTDSTSSGASAQTKWYKVVNLAYSRSTLLKTSSSKAFQAFTNPAQLPNVQVKPDTVCLGVPTRLKAVSTNGTQDPVYEWRFKGVVQSSTTDELTLARLTSTDSIRVVITSRRGGTNVNSVSSTVARPASVQGFLPQITRQGDSLVSSIPFHNQWYNLGSGSLTNDTLFWIKPTAGNFGPYTVVNKQKYCVVNSPDTVSSFPVNVQNITSEAVSLFPQPTSDWLFVKLPEYQANALVEVYDLQGKLMKSVRHQQEQNLLSLSVKTLPNGMYVLRLTMDGKEVRKKFQVLHP